jgi:hypothetical protein
MRRHSSVLDVRSLRTADCDTDNYLGGAKIRERLAVARKEVAPEINVQKTKYMLVSRDQNAGQNQDIKIANRLFENVSQFKYLGTTVTNQNLIQEEVRRD